MSDIILELRNICKSFPGVKALDNVSFSIERGTVHALVGENGAGKSTLIKVLAGIYQPESGEMLFEGTPKHFKTPSESQAAGVSVVHQEIKLSETLSVAENVFLGNLIYKGIRVDWKAMRPARFRNAQPAGPGAGRQRRGQRPGRWRRNRWWKSARPSTATAAC